MISFMICMLIVLGFSILCNNDIVKHERKIYIGLVLLQFIQLLYMMSPSLKHMPYLSAIMNVMVSGTFATVIFIVVMFTGAIDSRWQLTRRLRRVRKVLSIAGSIAVVFHCLYYLYFFKKINLGILLTGLVAFLIMIPLWITSFNYIKRKIGGKRFIRIQKFAYLFYALLFMHIILANLNKREVDIDKLTLYIVIFTVYTVMRVHKYWLKKQAKVKRVH